MKSTLVYFFTDTARAELAATTRLPLLAAPCAVQALIADDELRARVLDAVAQNGGEPCPTALLSWDDLREGEGEDAIYFPYFTAREYDVLSRSGVVSLHLDPFDAAGLYGYSAADTLAEAGAL